MVRILLRELEGKTIRVVARIERYGKSSSTYLLSDIRDVGTGAVLTNHLWIEIGIWAQGFRIGDDIEFDAEVGRYIKGWLGNPSRAPQYVTGPEADWTLTKIANAVVHKFGPIARIMPDGSIKP